MMYTLCYGDIFLVNRKYLSVTHMKFSFSTIKFIWISRKEKITYLDFTFIIFIKTYFVDFILKVWLLTIHYIFIFIASYIPLMKLLGSIITTIEQEIISLYSIFLLCIRWFFLLMFTQYKTQDPFKLEGYSVVFY